MLPEEIIKTYFGRLLDEKQACKRCSLRITAPQPHTIDLLCEAARACRDNPNTLGVDLGTKAFFAVKSVSDMKLFLDYLTSNPTPVGSQNTGAAPTFVALGYSKGVF